MFTHLEQKAIVFLDIFFVRFRKTFINSNSDQTMDKN